MMIYLQMLESDKDKQKFEQLYTIYKGLMFHVAMQLLSNEQDAEDAVHQAFLSILECFSGVSEVRSPKTRSFVVIITERKAIDIMRKKSRAQTVPYDDLIGGVDIPCLVIMAFLTPWRSSLRVTGKCFSFGMTMATAQGKSQSFLESPQMRRKSFSGDPSRHCKPFWTRKDLIYENIFFFRARFGFGFWKCAGIAFKHFTATV